LSSLIGIVEKDNSFGIQLTWEANSATNSEIEVKWGKYDQAQKQALINVGERENMTPPDPLDDLFSAVAGSTNNIFDVLDNDTDPDFEPVLVLSVDPISAKGGSVTNNVNNVSYSPRAGFVGFDTFEYVATDPNGEVDTASVTVHVLPNSPPFALPDSF